MEGYDDQSGYVSVRIAIDSAGNAAWGRSIGRSAGKRCSQGGRRHKGRCCRRSRGGGCREGWRWQSGGRRDGRNQRLHGSRDDGREQDIVQSRCSSVPRLRCMARRGGDHRQITGYQQGQQENRIGKGARLVRPGCRASKHFLVSPCLSGAARMACRHLAAYRV